MFSQRQKNRANEAEKILGDRLHEVVQYLSKISTHDRNFVIKALQKQFELDPLDAGAVWYAWSTYQL